MREIKFRAWEKALGEMIPVYDIQFHNPKEEEFEGIRLSPNANQPTLINTTSVWRSLDEVVLMQFTGLHDKDGTEIYESDIVNVTHRGDRLDIIEWDNLSAWYHGLTKIRADEKNHPTWIDCKVVGNLYQNPELLK